jgi:hypothetical protein
VEVFSHPHRKGVTMTRILFDGASLEKKSPFWVRQFAVKATPSQDRFDVIFGVILPILCLVVDPVVFQGGILNEEPILGQFQVFAYLFSGIQIAVFLIWRTLNRHVTPAAGLLGGIALAGALFSFAVGVYILPFTLIGLIVLIGAAGFTPFFTAFVYLRTGVRALKCQDRNIAFESRFLLAAVAGLLSIGLPLFIHIQSAMMVSASMDVLLYGDAKQAALAVDRLKWLPVSTLQRQQIVVAYEREANAEKKYVLKQYYKDLTGEDIEIRLAILSD